MARMARSQILATPPTVPNKVLRTDWSFTRRWHYVNRTTERWMQIETERDDIRRIVRRYNRRFRRMSGQSLKGC